MSQYPPPGGQYPPGGQVPPGMPPSYPPGSGPQGFGPQGYSLPAMTRTSGAAVCSLVCGLVMCIPGLTGLVAIITGIVGIAETGKPGVRGRGMAIAGLILGILSLAGWGVLGAGGLMMFQQAKPQRVFAKTYINDLAANHIDQCVQNSSGNMTKDSLAADVQKMQGWGTLQDITVIAFNVSTNNGNYMGSVGGFCRFSGGQHSFQMTLVKDSSGQLKVDTFLWQN
jgi:hypothetical protein